MEEPVHLINGLCLIIFLRKYNNDIPCLEYEIPVRDNELSASSDGDIEDIASPVCLADGFSAAL